MADRMTSPAALPRECRCGYEASSAQDLDEHVEAMVALDDPDDHGER